MLGNPTLEKEQPEKCVQFLKDAAIFAYSCSKLPAYSGAFYLQLTILAFLLTVGAFLLAASAFLLAVGVFFAYIGKCVYWQEKNWEHSGREGIRKFLLFPNSGHFPLEK